MLFNTPVLFLIFNRPDTTKQVFEKIKELKPKYLYVAADGPRSNKPGEIELCEATRKIILNSIDWDCELKTLFRDDNLGCGIAVSEAIDWFFGNVEEGIILEDDTLPSTSFFNYCENMLTKYRDTKDVLHISGSSYVNPDLIKESYYFTRLPFIWGWATWRRAWQQYNFDIKYYSISQKREILNKVFSNKDIVEYWSYILENFHLSPKTFTWDYQWFLSIWKFGGLVIQPKVNLVKNIGFGDDATHTTNSNDTLSKIEANDLQGIIYNEDIKVNSECENSNFYFYFKNIRTNTQETWFSLPSVRNIGRKVKYRIGQVLFKFIQNYKQLVGDGANSYSSGGVSANLVLGKHTVIKPLYNITSSSIGDFTFVDKNSCIENTHIGKFCTIGTNFICGGDIPQPQNLLATAPMFFLTQKYNGISLSHKNKLNYSMDINIGNDVSIGMNVLIIGGIDISDGVIIKPGTLVNENIPPYAIVEGNPMRVVGFRYDQETIDRLLKIKWWNWSEEKLHLIEETLQNEQVFLMNISKHLTEKY